MRSPSPRMGNTHMSRIFLRPNFVSVIDTATNMVVATVPVAWHARMRVAFTPDGKHAYVTNIHAFRFFPLNVSVIDTATNIVVATVPLGNTPLGVAVTPDGKQVYVTNASSPEMFR